MTEKRVQHRHPRRNDSDCGNPFDIIKALFGHWYYTKKPELVNITLDVSPNSIYYAHLARELTSG